MVWMAVSLKVILCSSYFISLFSDFSDASVSRRGRSLRWISKIFNRLIFSDFLKNLNRLQKFQNRAARIITNNFTWDI